MNFFDRTEAYNVSAFDGVKDLCVWEGRGEFEEVGEGEDAHRRYKVVARPQVDSTDEDTKTFRARAFFDIDAVSSDLATDEAMEGSKGAKKTGKRVVSKTGTAAPKLITGNRGEIARVGAKVGVRYAAEGRSTGQWWPGEVIAVIQNGEADDAPTLLKVRFEQLRYGVRLVGGENDVDVLELGDDLRLAK